MKWLIWMKCMLATPAARPQFLTESNRIEAVAKEITSSLGS